MNYLCMTVQREVVENQSFANLELAEDYFCQRFEGVLEEKFKEEKRKLENRIRYYERRAQKHRESQEITETCSVRREEAREALGQINRRLRGEDRIYRDYCYEETYGITEELVSGKAELVLHLAGIIHIRDSYWVTEERYYCTKAKSSSEKGIMRVREEISEDMVANSIFLGICQDNPEAEARLKQKVKKVVTQSKKEFRKRIGRSQLLGRVKTK